MTYTTGCYKKNYIIVNFIIITLIFLLHIINITKVAFKPFVGWSAKIP